MMLFQGQLMAKILPESIAGLLKDKKVVGSCQHAFTKGKWCLTDLRLFSVDVTSFVDAERAVAGV